MAVVDGPLMSHQATGSIGALTFCYTNGGNSVRARVSPNNTRSFYQGHYRRMGFNASNWEYFNESALRKQQWVELAARTRRKNKLGNGIATQPRNEFMNINIPVQYYRGGGQPAAASPIGAKYFPDFTLTWTGSGLQLSWSPSIETNGFIVVRQWRNLTQTQVRWHKFVTSHVFDDSFSSPQLISGGIGVNPGPRYLPVVVAGLYFAVEIMVVSGNARRAPSLRFRVQAA